MRPGRALDTQSESGSLSCLLGELELPGEAAEWAAFTSQEKALTAALPTSFLGSIPGPPGDGAPTCWLRLAIWVFRKFDFGKHILLSFLGAGAFEDGV